MATEEFLRTRLRSLITDRRESLQLSYKELASKLETMGIAVTDRQLAKRINRGNFSFVFAAAVLLAMDVREITLPVPPALRKRKAD